MRSSDFIIETSAQPSVAKPNLNSPINLIKRDCGALIARLSGRLGTNKMFRGLKRPLPSGKLSKLKVDKNRSPKDMPLRLHEMIDTWFQRESGIRYRSEAVFASSSVTIASTYGTVNSFFPIGNFSFCWSPVYDDLFTKLDMHIHDHPGRYDYSTFPEELINEFMNAGKYKFDSGLAAGIQMQHEIMFYCDTYYAGDLVSMGISSQDLNFE